MGRFLVVPLGPCYGRLDEVYCFHVGYGVGDLVEAGHGEIFAGEDPGHCSDAEPGCFGDLGCGHPFARVCRLDFGGEGAVEVFFADWHCSTVADLITIFAE